MKCLSFAFQEVTAVQKLAEKYGAQCLPIVQVQDQPIVFTYGTVVKLSQYTGHSPIDWQQKKTGEIVEIKISEAYIKECLKRDQPVAKTKKFVDLLMNDVKNEGVLQPVLARTCVMPLSQQRNVRDYIYRWMAGEHKKPPQCFPDLPVYLQDNATELKQIVHKLISGRMSYKTAVSNGVNGYELRYLLKGLASLGLIDGTRLNKMFGI